MNSGKIVADGTGGRVEKSKVLQEVLADLKTIQRFSIGFQGRTVDLGKPKDILLHTLSALGNHPGLDGSVSIFSSPKFSRKTKKNSHLCLRILPPRGPVLWGDDG